MTHSYGVRKGTRSKFAKAFRGHGAIRIKKYLTTYKRGDYVDIVVDGSQHKGMPHSFYHGQTARVFNVNPRSVGVTLRKQLRGNEIEKRFHVRVEHLRPSQCRVAFVQRVKQNDKIKTEANKAKKPVSTKRQPVAPRLAEVVKPKVVEFQHPKQFVQIVCTCGRKEQEDKLDQEQLLKDLSSGQVQSSCGSCYLGDAFRCANCPYRGLPAFKQGDVIQVNQNAQLEETAEDSGVTQKDGKVKLQL